MEKVYGRIVDLYENVLSASGMMFHPECVLIEEALASSFSVYSTIAKTAGTPDAKLDERHRYMLVFFYRNCIYLSAAYQLVRRGMLDPAGNNMRTVFETIIWQYAYLTDDNIYENFRQISAIEGEKLALIRIKKWSNTKERTLENLRRKYSFQKVLKKLYPKEHYERFFYSQYWAFCQKSHSSIVGINYNTPNLEGTATLAIENGPEELKGNLITILYLCAENLTCLLNCFHGSMDAKVIDALLALVNRINRSIPLTLSLAPDTKKLEFTMRFREV